jgi:hypothetical protein
MKFKPTGRSLVILVCLLIIVVSLGQVAARGCTLSHSSMDPDQRWMVCIVRWP